MALSGHMTKLEAVNDILASIGEDPVSSLSSGLPDAELAEDFLDRESRRIQAFGWHCNRLEGYAITRNASNQFALPDNTLKVDTVNARQSRKVTTPRRSGHIDASMRRAGDDSKYLLWDNVNNRETWPDDTEITVDLIQYLEFTHLTPSLQMYVWTSAAHRFQKSVMGSNALREFTREDVLIAEAQAIQEDMENQDANLYRDNQSVYNGTYRYNPYWGS